MLITRKHIATLLLVVMLCILLFPCAVFAHDVSSTHVSIEKCKVNTDVIYVDDGAGNLVPVEIVETVYYGTNSTITPMDFTPTAKVGERRTYSVKISNEAMGFPSLAGATLSLAAKRKAAQILEKAIAKKLGASFIPGLNFVSWALATVAFANAITGKSGIIVTTKFEYTKKYLPREGYYIYGWTPTSLAISRY